jgi:hypothetical protein
MLYNSRSISGKSSKPFTVIIRRPFILDVNYYYLLDSLISLYARYGTLY